MVARLSLSVPNKLTIRTVPGRPPGTVTVKTASAGSVLRPFFFLGWLAKQPGAPPPNESSQIVDQATIPVAPSDAGLLKHTSRSPVPSVMTTVSGSHGFAGRAHISAAFRCAPFDGIFVDPNPAGADCLSSECSDSPITLYGGVRRNSAYSTSFRVWHQNRRLTSLLCGWEANSPSSDPLKRAASESQAIIGP
jgi:hypothetical protein